MEDLYILDATGYIFRSYFAIRNMSAPDGRSTGAFYGFIKMLQKLIDEKSPLNIVAVFDGPKNKEKRLKIYSEYKANRGAPPEDLPHQIQWAIEHCKNIGVPTLQLEGTEADDVIGSVATWAKEVIDGHIFICSSDKDLAQLIDDKIQMILPSKENQLIDLKGVIEKYGVRADQIIDFLSITGDTSDNIPGIPGLGPKTAQSLLEKFDSLEKILENIDKIKGKKGETIAQNRNMALLSQKLVTIFTDENIPKNKEYYLRKKSDRKALLKLYQELNFNSLLVEFDTQNQQKKQPVNVEIISNKTSLKNLIDKLSQIKTPICIDTETTHISPHLAQLVGVGFAISEDNAYYIPINGQLSKEEIRPLLAPFLANPNLSFFGHNIKYDLHVLKNFKTPILNIAFDTMLASYLLFSDKHRHNLDLLALEHFGIEKTSTQELIGKGKNAITMDQVPIEKVANYCGEDVLITHRLKVLFKQKLFERKLESLYYNLELPLLSILYKMEHSGIFLNKEELKIQHEFVQKKLLQLTQEIEELAGEKFNLNSPKQLAHILFEKLQLAPPKKTKTGFSTNAETLTKLKSLHPIAKKILDYRQLEKLRSTYLESLPTEIHNATNRIHCTFNQSVASTGRLSCQNPNLQTIPIRSEIGRNIRAAFRPQKEGWSYLSADYSQVELRLLAHLSKDPTLTSAFLEGLDIHTSTASKVFNIPLQEVTKEQRSRAKAVNFGILYGQQAFGLSNELGISMKEAAKFIKTYFENFSHIKDYLQKCVDETKNTKKAFTMLGRERTISDIESKNPILRNQAERLAINTPVQGSAADMIKKAMIEIDAKITQFQGYCVLQIHDELLFELPDSEIVPFSQTVKETMENVFQISVPLLVDVMVGKNWKEC